MYCNCRVEGTWLLPVDWSRCLHVRHLMVDGVGQWTRSVRWDRASASAACSQAKGGRINKKWQRNRLTIRMILHHRQRKLHAIMYLRKTCSRATRNSLWSNLKTHINYISILFVLWCYTTFLQPFIITLPIFAYLCFLDSSFFIKQYNLMSFLILATWRWLPCILINKPPKEMYTDTVCELPLS